MRTRIRTICLATETLRLRAMAEVQQGRPLEFDKRRVMRFLSRHVIDAMEAIEIMRSALRKKKSQRFGDAYGAFLLVADGATYNDHLLLDSLYGRLTVRLSDRMLATARRTAIDDDLPDEAAVIAGAVAVAVRIGAGVGRFRKAIRYRASDDFGAPPWSSPHGLRLPASSGTWEERDAYQGASFTALERRVLERFFAKRFPPIGAIYTLSVLASDIAGRYACATEQQLDTAITTAEQIFDDVLREIE